MKNTTMFACVLCALNLSFISSVETYATSTGISGRTFKPGSTPGCGGCHGSQSTGTSVTISGVATVAVSSVNAFTVNLSGSSGSNSGIDIAVFRGSLSLSPSSSFLKVLNNELTHTQARPSPASFQFNYTAPTTAGSDTMYATGKGGASSNSWNHASKFVITVVAAPAAPVLVSPLDGATGVSTQPTMTWNAVSGATSYRLQVSTNSSFTTTVFDDASITGTSRQVTPPLANGSMFFWRVGATNIAGTTLSSSRNFTTSLTDVHEIPGVPIGFSLGQNYPNPFNPSTTISYAVSKEARVSVKIYSVAGEAVVTLVQGERSVGYYELSWDGRNESGMRVASGVYLTRMVAEPADRSEGVALARRIIFLK